MGQLRQQPIEQLKRIKRWQWLLLFAVILSSLVAIDLHTAKISVGFWGILDDEIAVVTIETDETDEDGQQNITIKDPSKSAWDWLGLLIVPFVLVLLGAEFQRKQQEQSYQMRKAEKAG